MHNNRILSNINMILANSKIFESLTLNDLKRVYSNYSIGIDSIAKFTCETLNYDMAANKFPKNINKNLLYRGSNKRDLFSLMTPQKRVSKDTNNIYTLLMSDILPSWKEYPKRNRSIISTNSQNAALDYMKNDKQCIYNVIPPNNAKMVVSPTADVWFAFKNILSRDSNGLAAFNDIISKVLGIFNYFMKYNYDYINLNELLISDRDINDFYKNIVVSSENFNNIITLFHNENMNEIYKIIDFMDNMVSKNKDILKLVYDLLKISFAISPRLLNLLEYIFTYYDQTSNFIKSLDMILDPEKAGFYIVNYNNLNINYLDDVEIWTESPCLLMQKEFYFNNDFLEEYFKLV